jgi:effector-binding domain-containing protein
MKALKIFGGIALVLVLAFAIAMFVFPTKLQVERTIEINAPKVLVHEYVSQFKLMHEWSPWTKLDPNMKSEITGEDGTVGAKYSWESELDNVGKGVQELTLITEDSVHTLVTFTSPFQSVANAYVILEALTPTTTKVTWGFVSDAGRPGNVFMGLMNAAETVNADYQKGLDSLKVITERVAANKTYRGYKIEEVTMPETHFGVVRDTVNWADMDAFYQTNLPAVYETVGKNGKQPGTTAGLVYVWDEVNQQADMCVGVAYTPAGDIPGLTTITRSGQAFKINYYGAYEGSAEAHMALEEYFTEKGLKTNLPVIELYITDPTTEPDTSKWLTEIYYLPE